MVGIAFLVANGYFVLDDDEDGDTRIFLVVVNLLDVSSFDGHSGNTNQWQLEAHCVVDCRTLLWSTEYGVGVDEQQETPPPKPCIQKSNNNYCRRNVSSCLNQLQKTNLIMDGRISSHCTKYGSRKYFSRERQRKKLPIYPFEPSVTYPFHCAAVRNAFRLLFSGIVEIHAVW
jgi:hypothetical protein